MHLRTPEQDRARLRSTAALAAVLVASIGSATAAVLHANAVKQEAGASLAALQRQVQRELTKARQSEAIDRQSQALEVAIGDSAPLSVVLRDLSTLSQVHRPGTPIEGFHWRPGAYGVEVRGSAEPFTSPDVRRLSKSLRPDVWLWAVSREPAGSRP